MRDGVEKIRVERENVKREDVESEHVGPNVSHQP